MRWLFSLFVVFSFVLFVGPAAATKVVLISSEDSASMTSTSEAKAKSPSSREMKAQKDRQDEKKRQRLLKELQELYKPRHSGK